MFTLFMRELLLKKRMKNMLEDEQINAIKTITNYVISYKNYRSINQYDEILLYEICNKITYVLKIWTGETYVGNKKEKNNEKIFQDFFISLKTLIRFCDNKELEETEYNLAKLLMYSGTIYRYLGSCEHNNKAIIEPEYNDIFVSWDKNKYNHYNAKDMIMDIMVVDIILMLILKRNNYLFGERSENNK